MNGDDYEGLASVLASAIEAAMWSTDYTEQVGELDALREVLDGRAKDLPLHEPARVRLEILHFLKKADEYADDARAKEFGTLFVLLETVTADERAKLAALLVQLLRFAAGKGEAHA